MIIVGIDRVRFLVKAALTISVLAEKIISESRNNDDQ